MKALIKYTFSFFVISMLILSTTGITVYSHFCSNNNKLENYLALSDVDASDCCETGCQEKPTDCCSSGCDDQDTNDCCSEISNYLVIKTEYIVPDETGFSPTITCAVLSPGSILKIKDIEDVINTRVDSFNLPPPLTGSEIILRLNTLKIAPSDPVV